MPSGAKKRKAAKKKKGTHNNNNNNNHNHNNNNPTHENDEQRSQDEKSSDGGSPTSRDHDARTHPFDDGSQKGDTSADHSPVAQNESIEQFASKQELKDDDTSKIAEEMKSEENEEIKEISIDYVEPAKEVGGKDGTINFSSSDYVPTIGEEKSVEKEISYDETKPTEEVRKVAESAKADDNIIVGPGSVVDEVKFVVPVSDEAVDVIKSVSVENSTVCDESGSSVNGNSEKLLPTTDENIEILPPAEIMVKTLPFSEENVEESLNLVESAVISNESTALTFSEVPSVVTNRGTEIIKDSETEPLIAPAPAQQVARKTSWLNCCGIFDVLTGSSR